MNVELRGDGALRLLGMNPLVLEFLRGLPAAADPEGSPEAEARLFPQPMADPAESLVQDWKEVVEPDLRHIFQSARQTVVDDLATVQESEAEGASLVIVREHFDAWLSTLNQARLGIWAGAGLKNEDMEEDLPVICDSSRSLALLQIHFYGFLQECLLEEEP